MIRRNKWKVLISSIIIILPMIVGFAMRGRLPEEVSRRMYGVGGAWTVFTLVLPLVLLVLQWAMLLIESRLGMDKAQSPKIVNMVIWIIPSLSVYVTAVMYSVAFGLAVNVFTFICILAGIGLMLMGNYMPKCRRNKTVGLKLSWALASDDNWNRTHRFGGRVMFACGVILLALAFVPARIAPFAMMAVIFAMVLIPTIYSYVYYRKQVKAGEVDPKQINRQSLGGRIVAICVGVACTVLVIALMLVGSIDVSYSDTGFAVDATFAKEVSIQYSDIDAVEYRESGVNGTRVNGFASMKLQHGWFSNEEFGNYTRFTRSGERACVVLTVDGERIVIGLGDNAQTRELYEKVLKNMG